MNTVCAKVLSITLLVYCLFPYEHCLCLSSLHNPSSLLLIYLMNTVCAKFISITLSVYCLFSLWTLSVLKFSPLPFQFIAYFPYEHCLCWSHLHCPFSLLLIFLMNTVCAKVLSITLLVYCLFSLWTLSLLKFSPLPFQFIAYLPYEHCLC